ARLLLSPSSPRFPYTTLFRSASGSAGKLMVFAVRTRTFPKVTGATTFYVGTNSPAELEDLRRAILTSDMPLPVSGEYMGRPSFDLAETYGKDTFVSIKHAGSREQIKLFALKNWANGVFAKLPFFGQTVADTIAQRAFALLPQQLPERMLKFRDRFEHHLLLVVSGEEKDR